MDQNTWLWIAQGLLAVLFGMAGVMKSSMPIPRLASMLKWPGAAPHWLTRFIGVSELAGGIAMILPIMLDILPWLTPLAAAGFIVIQILGIGVHAQRKELAQTLPINIVLLGLSAFVLAGRWDLFT